MGKSKRLSGGSSMSIDKMQLRQHAKAKRVYKLRKEGMPVSKVAALVECKPSPVRTLQLLGERLLSVEDGAHE